MDSGVALRHRYVGPPKATKRRWHPATAMGAWLSQARLDHELASGADPLADRKRAYRAHRLASPRMRRRIAGSIESVIEDAEHAWHGMSSEAPAQRRLVL